ncbi:DNA repair protein RadC [Balneolaceae bacterium ANBcel3]|nr:DNA repair protein RadC [Balneolaceae bacterium ANBcel3]
MKRLPCSNNIPAPSSTANGLQVRMVRDLARDELPRERLTRFGAESLTDSELLSILLRTGSRKMNVIDTCRNLLDHFGGLHKLVRKSWKEIRVIDGIADVKAITLEAAFELSRRLQARGNNGETISFRSPEDVAAYFGPRLRDLQTEQFMVAFLNASKKVTGHHVISKGGRTATIVDPAEVMRQAIMNESNSIIVVHNHPSGNRKASQADISLTKKLMKAAEMLDITVDDHVIIAGYDYLSLRQEGLMG